jgi:hypothetical protein
VQFYDRYPLITKNDYYFVRRHDSEFRQRSHSDNRKQNSVLRSMQKKRLEEKAYIRSKEFRKNGSLLDDSLEESDTEIGPFTTVRF